MERPVISRVSQTPSAKMPPYSAQKAGAVVPLVVSAAPFIARMVETALSEVDAGVFQTLVDAHRQAAENGLNDLN